MNFLQKLEYPIDLPTEKPTEMTVQGETVNDTFVQDSMAVYLNDCVEIAMERERVAQGSGIDSTQIPDRVTPLAMDPNDQQYRNEISVSILNEKQEKNGRFGWCIMCRKGADFYCKDSRFPVCSAECKIRYLEQEQICDKRDNEFNKVTSMKKKQMVSDCLSMFKSFMKYAFQASK